MLLLMMMIIRRIGEMLDIFSLQVGVFESHSFYE